MSVTLEDLEKIDLIVMELINRQPGAKFTIERFCEARWKDVKYKNCYREALEHLLKDDPSFIVDALDESITPKEKFERIFGITPTEELKRYREANK